MQKSKVCSREEIIQKFHDGQTIMIGGFGDHGAPKRLIQCLLDSGAKHLTVIANDTGFENAIIGRLIHASVVDKMICSHIGMNPEMMDKLNKGEIKAEFYPQGTLAEMIRAGSAGLGGVLTKTGFGTECQEGRTIIHVNNEDYIYEPPLHADLALVRARKGDPIGNLSYHGTMQNFNPVMAMNTPLTIAEVDFLMDMDEIGIDGIHTPGVFVNMILENQEG